jgi:hypothetical protein
MDVRNYQVNLNRSDLSLLIKIIRNEIAARQRQLDNTSFPQHRDGRPAIPSLSVQQEEFSNLAKIYRQLYVLEQQDATT